MKKVLALAAAAAIGMSAFAVSYTNNTYKTCGRIHGKS